MKLALLATLAIVLYGCGSRALPLLDGAAPDARGAPEDGPASILPDGPPASFCSSSADCPDDGYCHIEGACLVSGAIMGSCVLRPQDCDQDYQPVCGCDGTTYGNACSAHSAGVNVAYPGECANKCGSLFYLPSCGPAEVCDFKDCKTSVGECVKKPTLQECQVLSGPVVCGCDNQTYLTDCERVLAGVARSHLGGCQPQVTVVTDKASYDPGEEVQVTVDNSSSQSVFLGGCGIYSWQRQEGGVWVEKGPGIICGWEGNAVELEAGGLLVEATGNGAGTWRLRLDYGVGCLPDKPLSGAACTSFFTAYSNVFTILPSQQQCIDLQQKYQAALPAAKSCSAADPTLHCQHLVVSSLDCNCKTYVESGLELASISQAFANLGCSLIPVPVCPPVPCPVVQGSACIDGSCVDLGP